jgi:uncharacterized LabA/DUF88 family protein
VRAVAFIDGQNLFGHAKSAWGYKYANYCPKQLAERICSENGWTLTETHFYTGIHEVERNAYLHYWWRSKLDYLRSTGVRVFTRKLRYSPVEKIYRGIQTVEYVAREKGVDVRMALDIVRYALDNKYDVALIFSQDQDLSEAVDDVRAIARLQGRDITIACAFPDAPRQRGVNKSDWKRIPKAMYDECLDPTDHKASANGQLDQRGG